MWENGDQTQYFNFNNIIQCKAHIEYIARLSIHGGKKSLAIMDSGADTHVFGKGWLPLFEKGPHMPTADLIGFDSLYAKKQNLPIGPHAALVRTENGDLIILRAEHGVSNPTANHTLLSTFECREQGIMVDDCHKNHIKSINGEKGTQSIQFKDSTKIDLICKAALMTFYTETLTWKDIEEKKYSIYEIVIPEWNPKDHFDDPYAFTEMEHQNEPNVNNTRLKNCGNIADKMPPLLDNYSQQEMFCNSSYMSINNATEQTKSIDTVPLETISVSWDIEHHYKDNETMSIMSLMGINLEQEENLSQSDDDLSQHLLTTDEDIDMQFKLMIDR